MTTRHTPGPWRQSGRYMEANGATIGELFGDLDQRDANARLIASAPDLLEFVAGFLADYQSEDGLYDMKHYAKKAHELVVKATGEA